MMKNMATMRRILVLMLFLLGPSGSLAHPGKTDYQDAHRCLKNCGEWDLEYGEYHLHDKDRNPIRIGPKDASVKGRILQEETVSDQKPLPAPAALEQPARIDSPRDLSVRTVDPGRVMPVSEEGTFQLRDMLLMVIAAILVMVLFFLRRKKESG